MIAAEMEVRYRGRGLEVVPQRDPCQVCSTDMVLLCDPVLRGAESRATVISTLHLLEAFTSSNSPSHRCCHDSTLIAVLGTQMRTPDLFSSKKTAERTMRLGRISRVPGTAR